MPLSEGEDNGGTEESSSPSRSMNELCGVGKELTSQHSRGVPAWFVFIHLICFEGLLCTMYLGMPSILRVCDILIPGFRV